MITRPEGSSTYNVFCGSIGFQSDALEAASTSAAVSNFRGASVSAACESGAEISAATHAATNSLLTSTHCFVRLNEFVSSFLSVAVEHARVVEIEQCILDSRKAGA